LNVVDDQIGAPTTASELARATQAIATQISQGKFAEPDAWTGTYHMTCSGSVSWCGFARAIFQRSPNLLDGKKPTVNPISASEYPTPAKRPRNSVLSNEKLQRTFGVHLASWESALDEVLTEIAAKRKA